jgi:ribosome-binding factor A
MSKRVARVNQLLRMEISDYLHRRFRAEAIGITISEVDASPDFRNARVFYSVLGDNAAIIKAEAFFSSFGKRIQQEVASKVVMKFFPRLEFRYDESFARGAQLLQRLDEIAGETSTGSSAENNP